MFLPATEQTAMADRPVVSYRVMSCPFCELTLCVS